MIRTRAALLDEIKCPSFEELAPGIFHNHETGETLISDGEQAIVVTATLKKDMGPLENKEVDESIAYILKNEPGETLIFNEDDD